METISPSQFRVKLVFSRTLYSQSVASVTMGSLAAYLRSFGQQTDLCLFGDDMSHNTEIVLKNDDHCNIVIAKPNFKDFRTMLPYLERLKTSGLVQRVFLCGPFARLNSKGLMSRLVWLDGIFVDQPEVSVVGLFSTMSEDLMSSDFQSCGSISRNTTTGIVGVYRPIKKPIPLSQLPFPARDVEAKENVSFVNIEASRGCLFDCSFCHTPLMSGVTLKSLSLNIRDPKLVVDEIEQLNKELGKTLFIFNDSCFWSTKKDDARILCFCEEIAKRKLNVHFYVYLKGEPFISDEILQALVGAGLVRVFLGVENSVKSTLATYRKKIRPNLYEMAKAKLDTLGVNIHIGFIAIEPHSSLEDVLLNVEYLYSIGKLFRHNTQISWHDLLLLALG
jgi:anaerobic magnesium-protoporphyrin IX monomethyl ester cyclase